MPTPPTKSPDEIRALMESAPQPVKNAATLLFLYACVSFLMVVITAVMTKFWLILLTGLTAFLYPVLLSGRLYEKKKWSYFVGVIGGFYYALRLIWALPHPPAKLPIPYGLYATNQCIGAIFGLLVAGTLLMPEARRYFFPAKQTPV
jgi:hypothetical protein